MREVTMSASGTPPVRAFRCGHHFIAEMCEPPGERALVLDGDTQFDLAAVTAWVVAEGHAVVLRLRDVATTLAGTWVDVT